MIVSQLHVASVPIVGFRSLKGGMSNFTFTCWVEANLRKGPKEEKQKKANLLGEEWLFIPAMPRAIRVNLDGENQ